MISRTDVDADSSPSSKSSTTNDGSVTLPKAEYSKIAKPQRFVELGPCIKQALKATALRALLTGVFESEKLIEEYLAKTTEDQKDGLKIQRVNMDALTKQIQENEAKTWNEQTLITSQELLEEEHISFEEISQLADYFQGACLLPAELLIDGEFTDENSIALGALRYSSIDADSQTMPGKLLPETLSRQYIEALVALDDRYGSSYDIVNELSANTPVALRDVYVKIKKFEILVFNNNSAFINISRRDVPKEEQTLLQSLWNDGLPHSSTALFSSPNNAKLIYIGYKSNEVQGIADGLTVAGKAELLLVIPRPHSSPLLIKGKNLSRLMKLKQALIDRPYLMKQITDSRKSFLKNLRTNEKDSVCSYRDLKFELRNLWKIEESDIEYSRFQLGQPVNIDECKKGGVKSFIACRFNHKSPAIYFEADQDVVFISSGGKLPTHCPPGSHFRVVSSSKDNFVKRVRKIGAVKSKDSFSGQKVYGTRDNFVIRRFEDSTAEFLTLKQFNADLSIINKRINPIDYILDSVGKFNE